MATEFQVRLQRDSLQTPWGIRIQGGKDFRVPLTIQRVFSGTAAQGNLQRGDIIVAIENYDAGSLTHKQAQDMIRRAGGSLYFRIRRCARRQSDFVYFGSTGGQAYRPSPRSKTPPPTPTYLGLDYLKYAKPYFDYYDWGYRTTPLGPSTPKSGQQFGYAAPPSNKMLHYGGHGGGGGGGGYYPQAQSDIVLQPRDYEDDVVDYQYRPVSELKKSYAKPNVRTTQRRPPPRSPVRQAPPPWVREQQQHEQIEQAWSPVRAGTGRFDHAGAKPKTDLGWTPQPRQQLPPHVAPKPIGGQQIAPSYVRAQAPDEGDYMPAWQGSLRSGRGAKVQDSAAGRPMPPMQHVAAAPGGGGGRARAPAQVQLVESAPAEGPVAHHNPYNTPLGLYSKSSAQEAMDAQLKGRPGEGTVQISGGSEGPPSFENSPTYRLIHRQERPPSSNPRQSQAFRALEDYTSTSQPAPRYNTAEEEGISEF